MADMVPRALYSATVRALTELVRDVASVQDLPPDEQALWHTLYTCYVATRPELRIS